MSGASAFRAIQSNKMFGSQCCWCLSHSSSFDLLKFKTATSSHRLKCISFVDPQSTDILCQCCRIWLCIHEKIARIVSEKSNGLNKYWHIALQTHEKETHALRMNDKDVRRVIYLICLVIISPYFSVALLRSLSSSLWTFNCVIPIAWCLIIAPHSSIARPFASVMSLFTSIYRMIETITQMNWNY